MGLRRNRGPYVPQREPVRIDYQAMQAASDRARQEQVRVEADAIRWAQEARGELNPVAQLVKRCAGIDLRADGLEARIAALEEFRELMIEMLKEKKKR